MSDSLVIGGREFGSRLITGSGKYADFEVMRDATVAAGAEMVTVAVRLVDFDSEPGDLITDFFPDGIQLLPNTAGAKTADDAIRVARLARAGGLPAWIKLEVIPDTRYLLPDGPRRCARPRRSSPRASPSCRTSSPTPCSRGSSRRSAARR